MSSPVGRTSPSSAARASRVVLCSNSQHAASTQDFCRRRRNKNTVQGNSISSIKLVFTAPCISLLFCLLQCDLHNSTNQSFRRSTLIAARFIMFATAWTSMGRWGRAPWKLILTTTWRGLKLGVELRKPWRFMTLELWVSLSLFSPTELVQLRLFSACLEKEKRKKIAVSVNTACLWSGAGNYRNSLLWRWQVLHQIPNQSQSSAHGSSQQRVANVRPGMYTLLHTERCKLEKVLLLWALWFLFPSE